MNNEIKKILIKYFSDEIKDISRAKGENAVQKAESNGMLKAYKDSLGIMKDIEIKIKGFYCPSSAKTKIQKRIDAIQKATDKAKDSSNA